MSELLLLIGALVLIGLGVLILSAVMIVRRLNGVPWWTCTRCGDSYRAPYESAGRFCGKCEKRRAP